MIEYGALLKGECRALFTEKSSKFPFSKEPCIPYPKEPYIP